MKWVWYYLIFQACVVLFFWLFSKRKDKRYKITNLPLTDDFEPTQEVSIDPVTKVVKRVYVNRNTGERRYIDEKGEDRHD